jgi:hypothetical protein
MPPYNEAAGGEKPVRRATCCEIRTAKGRVDSAVETVRQTDLSTGTKGLPDQTACSQAIRVPRASKLMRTISSRQGVPDLTPSASAGPCTSAQGWLARFLDPSC